MTEQLHFHFSVSSIGEGTGNPLQYSCLGNPMDRGAWWATVHGATRSWTRLSDFIFMHWRRKWRPTPVFLPGESQGRGSLVYGVTKSWTLLKQLSSSSSIFDMSFDYPFIIVIKIFRQDTLLSWFTHSCFPFLILHLKWKEVSLTFSCFRTSTALPDTFCSVKHFSFLLIVSLQIEKHCIYGCCDY